MTQSHPITSSEVRLDDAPFPVHFERAGRIVRAALTELLASVSADPTTPQVIARRMRVSKNLAWRICKIVNSPDVTKSIQHLPGASGIGTLLRAFAKDGAPEPVLRGVRDALAEFDRMAVLHAGNRVALSHMTEGLLDKQEQALRQEQTRKQAYQANSAIFGVRARVRMGIHVMCPDVEAPDRLSYANITGLLDFERLRADVSWPLAQFRVDARTDESAPSNPMEPIDPAGEPGAPVLLREFSSTVLPDIREVQEEGSVAYECAEGPLGKTGAISLVLGWKQRRFSSIYGDETEKSGEYFTSIRTPVAHLIQDLFVHRDLPYELPPRVAFYNLVHARIVTPLAERSHCLLPTVETVEDLGSGPPIVSTPLVPRHAEIAARAVGALGRNLDEFRAFRVTMAFPPIPTLAIQHFPLPLPPGGSPE